MWENLPPQLADEEALRRGSEKRAFQRFQPVRLSDAPRRTAEHQVVAIDIR